MTHQRFTVRTLGLSLLGALMLFASPSALAGPKPKKPGTSSKPQPTPKAPIGQGPAVHVDPAVAGKLRKQGPLSKHGKLDVVKKGGIQLEDLTLSQPAKLTVRAPFRNHGTHLSFIGTVAVLPGQGLAQLGGGFAVPNIDFGSLFPGSTSGSGVPVVSTSALVQFRTRPNKHYIVDCRVEGAAGEFEGFVASGDGLISDGVTHSEGHVITFVAAASTSRRIKVFFYNAGEWSLDQCEITPAG